MNGTDIVRIEAGDRSSFEAVRLFETVYASRTWSKAEVSRFDGLTLYECDGNKIVTALHFTCCLSGYSGQGPIATVAILNTAGFGDVEPLMEIVSAHDRHVFRR